jgi:hypothetical protein
LKATVSKTVMGHWPIESSNLSLSATLVLSAGIALPRRPGPRVGGCPAREHSGRSRLTHSLGDNREDGAHNRPEMGAVEPDAHTGKPRALAWRLIGRLRPRAPNCAFCPAAASDVWMIDPLGRVHGLCPHCLERMHEMSTVTK